MYMTALSHLALIAASCYALYALGAREHPYAYTTASFCLVHGLLTVARAFEEEEKCSRAYHVSMTVVHVLPLPMANVELYLKSSQSGTALVHTLPLIVLIYDMMNCLGNDWKSYMERVNDVSLLGNIVSAMYLGLREENYFHVGIAVAAGVARYGSELFKKYLPVVGPHMDTFLKAVHIGLLTYTLAEGSAK